MSLLPELAAGLASGSIEVVDLTHTLSEDFPTLVLPEPFGQTLPFSSEVISRYDENGIAWYWRNFTVGEHTGTHLMPRPTGSVAGTCRTTPSIPCPPATSWHRSMS
ncbi:MAG: hypothetical protein ABF826_14720 [Komagataeibacter saccharivorans]|uniref:cyclase family protein n=1 Tax=Komagataeibacter saccharivorans TaxID=265959 RepID=UPI0039EC9FF9